MDAPLWIPSASEVEAAPITAFMAAASQKSGRAMTDYKALHAWSVAEREPFWNLVWDHCGVIGEKGQRILQDGERMPGASFFPDARLNFAENLLKKSGGGDAKSPPDQETVTDERTVTETVPSEPETVTETTPSTPQQRTTPTTPEQSAPPTTSTPTTPTQ